MEAFLVSITTVAVAEMGDRTQLLSLVLAAHYRKPWPILAGVLLATLANHALAGIIGVFWQARIARREKAVAERRFNEVRELANSFLFEVHDAIQNLPGSTAARKLIVDRGLRYLDAIAKEARGNLSLQRELAALAGQLQNDRPAAV